MGDDFYIPIMSQDLMTSSMGMLNMPYGMYGGMPFGMMGPTPIPSPVMDRVKMQAQPQSDQFIASQRQKESKTKNTFIKAGIAFAALVALACIPGAKKSKAVKEAAETVKKSGFFKKINPFKKKAPAAP
ncbi:MAG: hypothetical protein LBJ74_02130 [Heliobacteriaceae bacterium]|jgi:hypothetical protein|nr:hypothetical protein [Heliobacteriaceae bacterium]